MQESIIHPKTIFAAFANKHFHLNLSLLMSAPQFSSKMLKRLKERGFCRKVLPTQRQFLQHLTTKVLHLNATLMMSALQFSSKMLKRLKERGFCGKV